MNHHVVPPLVLALITGVALPFPLARGRWPHQAPRLAIATWIALVGTFIVASGLTVLQVLMPYHSSHRLSDRIDSCLPGGSHGCTTSGIEGAGFADLAAALGAASVLLLPLGLFLRQSIRARRERSRHAEMLNLVARQDPAVGATVLDHPIPAVYCLPGRTSQIVVSTGALSTLTRAQLGAVLHHERAHITGRHHLLTAGTRAVSAISPRLPLFRHIRTEVPLLLEMAADDRALRRCSREALATALYSMAAGQVPQSTMAAGGPSAVLRVRRILTPEAGNPVLEGLLTAAAAVGATTPLIMACCSIPG